MGNKKNLKQTILLKLALQEEDINYKKCNIRIDHDSGISIVNNIKLPIIFPKSWMYEAEKLHTDKKEYKFYFNGFIGEGTSRQEILKDFIIREDSKIIWSNDGRNVENKNVFNKDYFAGLCKSVYGLCPHQPDWPGNWNTLWTYRYIECLMAKVIPINFKQTPLAKSFIEDSYFVWDKDVINNSLNIDSAKVEYNYNFAFNKFTLSLEQIDAIKSSCS